MNNRALRFEDVYRVLAFVGIFAFLLIDPLGIVVSDAVAASEGVASGDVPAPRQPGEGDGVAYGDVVDILSMVFVLAVLIEVGLSVLFKWRIFLRFADGRGWKVPIAFGVSLAIVITHSIDLPSVIVASFEMGSASRSNAGYLISALIIAGGSSSVNGLFEKLGWRNPVPQALKAEAERERNNGRLWIAIERKAGGSSHGQPVTVSIDGQQVALLAPTENSGGGTEGYAVNEGTRKIRATWVSQGVDTYVERDVLVVAGKSTTEKLTLT